MPLRRSRLTLSGATAEDAQLLRQSRVAIALQQQFHKQLKATFGRITQQARHDVAWAVRNVHGLAAIAAWPLPRRRAPASKLFKEGKF